MAEGVVFPFPSLPLNEGRTYGQPEVVLISLPQPATGSAGACRAGSVGGGFQPDLLCRRLTVAQRGRSRQLFTSAEPEEDLLSQYHK